MSRVIMGLRVRSWLVVLALVALAGLVAAEPIERSTAAPKDSDSAQVSSGEAVSYAKSLSKAFREAAEKVSPAVVMVQSRPPAVEQMKSPQGPQDDDEFFEGPFGD